MPIFDVSAARAFGFNSNPGPLGHLTSFQIGTADKLDADFGVEIPPADDHPDGGNIQVVGVLNAIAWGSGRRPQPTDPVYISAEISAANRAKVQELKRRSQHDVRITFSFVIYDYDQEAKRYFVACQGADRKPLQGRLRELADGDTSLEVADEATAMPGQANMAFELTAELLPESIPQTILIGLTPTHKVAKPWQAPGPDAHATAQEEMAGTTA
jgi:hypothetical protein